MSTRLGAIIDPLKLTKSHEAGQGAGTAGDKARRKRAKKQHKKKAKSAGKLKRGAATSMAQLLSKDQQRRLARNKANKEQRGQRRAKF